MVSAGMSEVEAHKLLSGLPVQHMMGKCPFRIYLEIELTKKQIYEHCKHGCCPVCTELIILRYGGAPDEN